MALSLFATACVPIWQQRPETSPEALWEARRIALTQLDRWKIQGRTAIVQGREGWNAGLHWREDKGSYQIKILGPFSQGGVSLEGNDEHVILTMADGEKLSSTDPELLITKALGVQLPINALRDWIRGLPYAEEEFESITFDVEGRITHLLQQGWEITFSRYVPFKQYSMPSKIFIRRSEQNLRLVITRWESVQ